MDPKLKLFQGYEDLFKDFGRYRRLIDKLNYVTVTRPDITCS